MRVCVVGAGISGIACAAALRTGGVDVVVRERARGPGGRMATARVAGRGADTGAQYFTCEDPRFRTVVDDWLLRGLARAWTREFHVFDGTLRPPHPGPDRFSAPAGLRSLVVDLAADLPLRFERPVAAVGAGPTVDGIRYDAVVLALPDPQALRLLDPALAAERAAVGRAWEPVLTLLSSWPERSWDVDGVFVNGDDTLSWIGDDGRRRGDGAPVLVSNSTGDFARPRLGDHQSAAAELVEATRRVLGLGAEPTAVRVKRWSFARPPGPRDEPFYLGPAGIGICGDGWGRPKVETAWLSGTLLAAALQQRTGHGEHAGDDEGGQ